MAYFLGLYKAYLFGGAPRGAPRPQGSAMVSAGEICLPWSLGDVTTKQRFWGLGYSWGFHGCMRNKYIYI